jgi:flagellar export protein FliJ
VARSREEGAAHALAEFQRRVDAHLARIQQLQAFRSEYREQLQELATEGIAASRLREYAGFLGSLHRRIAKSHLELRDLEAELAGRRESWVQHRAKVQALDAVIASCREEQRRIEGRKEQVETDERAAAQHRRRQDVHAGKGEENESWGK